MLSLHRLGRCHPRAIASRRGALIGVVGVVLTLISVPVAGFVSLLGWFAVCDGDGGFPYSARASVAGRFCDSRASTPFFVAQVVLPCLVMATATVIAVRRSRWSRIWAGTGLAVGVTVTMCVFLGALPSSCSVEQQRRHPYGCETY